MEPVKTSGSFSDSSCPRLLAHLHQARFDGTVRISRGALLKLLYFQGGEIAMASSNDQEDHLAPILIRAGKLKPEQMDLARKSMQGGTSLARVLVQMGFLTSGELFAGARQQLRQIVGSVLGMTDASYEIQSGYFPREITSLNVDTREMILDLIRDLSDRSFVLLEVGAPDTIYAPVRATNGGSEPVRLPRAWKEYAERFSTPLAIHEFGQGANLDDFAASKVVYGLSLLGCVAQEVPAEPESLAVPVVDAGAQSEESPATVAPVISIQPAEEGSLDEPASKEEPEAEPAAASVAKREEQAVEPIESFRERLHPPAPALSTQRPPSSAAPAFPGSAGSRSEGPDARFASREREAESEEEPSSQRAPAAFEFKLPHASQLPSRKPSRPWATASVIGGICLLALTSVWFIFLRVPEESSTSASAPASGTEAQAQSAAETAPQNEAPANPSSAGEATSNEARLEGQQAPSQALAQEGEAPALPPEAQGSSSAPPASKPEARSSEHPQAAGATAAPAPGAAPNASGFATARAELDAGSYAAAAKGWAQVFRSGPAPAFTLQIAIACQEETLRKAAHRTAGSDQFFVLPFALQGKVCYRLCWGNFPTLEAAQSARSSIPPSFIEEGGHPIVVSLQKSIATEGR
jgi:hypothetical protein